MSSLPDDVLASAADAHLAPLLSSPSPAWLFAPDGSCVVWANAAGVVFFGEASLADLRKRRFRPGAAFVRQIASLARALPEAAEPKLALLRFTVGLHSRAVSCLCCRRRLDQFGPVLLAAAVGTRESSRDMVEALRGAAEILLPGEPVAVLAEGGAVRWASAEWRESIGPALDGQHELLPEMIEMARHGGRAIMRLPGVRMTVVRLALEDQPIYVALAASSEAEDTVGADARRATDGVPAAPADAAPGSEAQNEHDPSATAGFDGPSATSAAPVDRRMPADSASGQPDSVRLRTLVTDLPRKALRFVWRMDARLRFSAVGPELGQALGPDGAALVGLTWGEVAGRLGLDPDGRIAQALSRRETWTAARIGWPLPGGDSVPVDLTGLPVFDADRQFKGYRGFGICRLDQVIYARNSANVPDVADAALVGRGDDPIVATEAADQGIARHPRRSAEMVPEQRHPRAAESPGQNETAARSDPGRPEGGVRTVADPATPETSNNVVQLRTDRPRPTNGSGWHLAQHEREAFREIARALGATVEIETPPLPAEAADEESPVGSPSVRDSDGSTSTGPSASDASRETDLRAANRGPSEHVCTVDTPEDADRQPAVEPLAEIGAPSRDGAGPPPAPAEETRAAVAAHGTGAGAASVSEPDRSVADLSTSPQDGSDTAGTRPSGAVPAAEAAASAARGRSEPPPRQASAVDTGTAVLDRLPIGILVVQEGRIAYANRRLLALFGYADADALASAGGMAALFDGSAPAPSGTGEAETCPVRATTANGMSLDVEARLLKLEWRGEPALLVTVEPVRKVPRGGQEAASLLGDMLDTMLDGVVLVGGDGNVERVNAALADLVGRPATDLVGRPFPNLFTGESRFAVLERLNRALRQPGRSPEATEAAMRGSSGLVPVWLTIGRIGAPEAGRLGVVVRDARDYRALLAELQQARDLAEAAKRRGTELLDHASHSLRTPLNALVGFADLMAEERFGPLENERYRSCAAEIRACGQELAAILDDIATVSRIESGETGLAFREIAVNQIVEQCVRELQAEAHRGRVIVRTSLLQSSPKVRADEASLRRVVLQLLGRVLRSSRSGGQVIVSSGIDETGRWFLRIRDTGAGVANERLQAASGTGQISDSRRHLAPLDGEIGLPLAQALVAAHRGTLVVDSETGPGTLLEMTLPAEPIEPS